MGIFESDTVSLREVQTGKTMNSHKMFEGKLTLKRKTCIFRDWSKSQASHQGKPPNTLETNFEKFSKCFSRLDVLPARKSRRKLRKSLSNVVTGTSTYEQVARLSYEKH